MLLYIIVGLFVLLVGYSTVRMVHTDIDAKRAVPRLARNYTWASQEIMKEYDALPQGHRPLGDIKPMLRALEIRFPGIGDSAFADRVRSGDETASFRYGWNFYREYRARTNGAVNWYNLHQEIQGLQDEFKRREEVLERKKRDAIVAGLGYDDDAMAEIQKRLREEKELIAEVTKEISK